MRLIDADKLIERLNAEAVPFNTAVNAAIIHAPTIDAVPVVRCKDCKYYKRVKGLPKSKYCRMLRGEPIVVDTEPDDFCSYAERKKNGEDR